MLCIWLFLFSESRSVSILKLPSSGLLISLAGYAPLTPFWLVDKGFENTSGGNTHHDPPAYPGALRFGLCKKLYHISHTPQIPADTLHRTCCILLHFTCLISCNSIQLHAFVCHVTTYFNPWICRPVAIISYELHILTTSTPKQNNFPGHDNTGGWPPPSVLHHFRAGNRWNRTFACSFKLQDLSERHTLRHLTSQMYIVYYHYPSGCFGLLGISGDKCRSQTFADGSNHLFVIVFYQTS